MSYYRHLKKTLCNTYWYICLVNPNWKLTNFSRLTFQKHFTQSPFRNNTNNKKENIPLSETHWLKTSNHDSWFYLPKPVCTADQQSESHWRALTLKQILNSVNWTGSWAQKSTVPLTWIRFLEGWECHSTFTRISFKEWSGPLNVIYKAKLFWSCF